MVPVVCEPLSPVCFRNDDKSHLLSLKIQASDLSIGQDLELVRFPEMEILAFPGDRGVRKEEAKGLNHLRSTYLC